MKVRLKHNDLGVVSSAGEFQFHEGPIKTHLQTNFRVVESLFQFHEGPIKTNVMTIMPPILLPFQFHEGPIKTQQAENMRKQNSVSIP